MEPSDAANKRIELTRMLLKHHGEMFREQLEIDWYDIDLRQKRGF